MKERILGLLEHDICLFCGEQMESNWEDREQYWECDCEDAKRDRELDQKIERLNSHRPKHKFTIYEALVLRKNEQEASDDEQEANLTGSY